jgi:N-acetylmuramic acid 6-phosphate etherase
MVTGIIAGGYDALKISIEGAEDDFAVGVSDANILTENDVAVAVSASGNPNYLMGVLSRANEIGCKTIGLTCNSKAKIAEEVSHLICVEVGPEVIAGASRMKAGTAQKMVLNMLSTGSMIKIGKTYKNFMIDLQVTNEKMKDRAIRIVSQLAEVQLSEAFAMLLKCDWNVKVAIVALKKQVDKDEAEKLLTVNRGVLRRVLGDL